MTAQASLYLTAGDGAESESDLTSQGDNMIGVVSVLQSAAIEIDPDKWHIDTQIVQMDPVTVENSYASTGCLCAGPFYGRIHDLDFIQRHPSAYREWSQIGRWPNKVGQVLACPAHFHPLGQSNRR